MDLIIKNVKIVDAKKTVDGDIAIKDGRIQKLGSEWDPKGIQQIDGKGLTAMPAFVDTHTHFREPGYEEKETIESGSMAAVKGGYTTVLLMGNTNPTASTKELVLWVQEKSQQIGLVDAVQCGTITENLAGESIQHLPELLTVTRFITDDGKGVMNDRLAYEAMLLAKKNNATVISHGENQYFSDKDMRLAENLMTYRDIELARLTGCRLHMAHVSTKEAIKRIIEAKKEGLPVTCEVTPHHIFGDSTTSYRVNPPLREPEDVKALIQAIKEGYVDAIGTDHAPHTQSDKEKGSPGISSIETSFGICHRVLVRENKMTLNALSAIMSERPAKLLGIKKGLIEPGYAGDIVLVDENRCEAIDPDKFVSKGKNSPFKGMATYGKVMMTVKAGKVVYQGENDVSR